MERERNIVTALLLLQVVLALGFFVHRSPRFPGTAWGGALGVSAALLMLVPLLYTVTKRVTWLKERMVARVRLPRLLTWHVYASIVGALLAILHSGHRFQSWIGILLTTAMLLAVLSGYIGQHFLRYVSLELKERQDTLISLRAAYEELAAHIAERPEAALALPLARGLRGRLAAVIVGIPALEGESDLPARALKLTGAIADIEHAISADDIIKRRLRVWLKVHIGASVAFYALLVLHVWSGIQYGLRWFD